MSLTEHMFKLVALVHRACHLDFAKAAHSMQKKQPLEEGLMLNRLKTAVGLLTSLVALSIPLCSMNQSRYRNTKPLSLERRERANGYQQILLILTLSSSFIAIM